MFKLVSPPSLEYVQTIEVGLECYNGRKISENEMLVECSLDPNDIFCEASTIHILDLKTNLVGERLFETISKAEPIGSSLLYIGVDKGVYSYNMNTMGSIKIISGEFDSKIAVWQNK